MAGPVCTPLEEFMWKAVVVGTASLMIAGSSLVYAQQQSGAPAAAPAAGSAAATAAATAEKRAQDWAEHVKALAEARLAAFKVGMKLTPDQDKKWPALETALNEMAKLNAERMAPARPAEAPGGAPAATAPADEEDPVVNLQTRADDMLKEATALKHLADAVGPLYSSLDDNQKQRFHMLAPPMLTYHLGGAGQQNQGNENEYGMDNEMNEAGGYGGPMGAPGQQGGYGAPMGAPGQQGGYGAPMMGPPGQQGGYGAPMGAPGQQGGYGAPMGAPGQQGGYGAPMMGPPGQQGGYGAPMGPPGQQGGYGAPMTGPPGQQGYYGGPMMGAPGQQGGYPGQAAQNEYEPEQMGQPGAQQEPAQSEEESDESIEE
jgi:zinc resistance-associated protein